jgi:hypothetical protein
MWEFNAELSSALHHTHTHTRTDLFHPTSTSASPPLHPPPSPSPPSNFTSTSPACPACIYIYIYIYICSSKQHSRDICPRCRTAAAAFQELRGLSFRTAIPSPGTTLLCFPASVIKYERRRRPISAATTCSRRSSTAAARAATTTPIPAPPHPTPRSSAASQLWPDGTRGQARVRSSDAFASKFAVVDTRPDTIQRAANGWRASPISAWRRCRLLRELCERRTACWT